MNKETESIIEQAWTTIHNPKTNQKDKLHIFVELDRILFQSADVTPVEYELFLLGQESLRTCV